MDFLIIILIILGGLAIIGVVIYNSLIQLRNRCENAWAQVDVQLRRRYDLIPNLVETVKGYARHEREVFERVTEARTRAINAATIAEQGQAENQLTSALKTLFAVVENYPELKANQNFLLLQEELAGTESKIAFARQFYNDTVMKYNIRLQVFPARLIAQWFGFKPKEYFEIEEVAAREPVKVSF
ncbi:MAG: LemA family protein [Candidatus Aminicenantes bacterium]|nr:LemA family protein [Candidatus Aminicenantes bacterium]